MTTENQALQQMNEGGQSVEERIMASLGGLPGQAEEAPAETTEVVDDGLDTLDWEGQTIKVPKGLKEAVMRTDDYTRKTQELAEARRAVDQVQELAKTQQLESSFRESIQAESQELHVIEAYLAQAAKMNWAEMSAEQMLRQRLEIDGIKERKAALQSSISEKRGKFQTELQARISDLRGKSRELASKSIQGFSEDTEKSMREYAKTEGLTDQEIDNVLLDPRSYKVIWKAMQFDKVKAGTGKAQEAASRADRVLRPGAAGERMPAKTAANLNFQKAMKAAGNDSGAKARVIEQRLTGVFSKG